METVSKNAPDTAKCPLQLAASPVNFIQDKHLLHGYARGITQLFAGSELCLSPTCAGFSLYR